MTEALGWGVVNMPPHPPNSCLESKPCFCTCGKDPRWPGVSPGLLLCGGLEGLHLGHSSVGSGWRNVALHGVPGECMAQAQAADRWQGLVAVLPVLSGLLRAFECGLPLHQKMLFTMQNSLHPFFMLVIVHRAEIGATSL